MDKLHAVICLFKDSGLQTKFEAPDPAFINILKIIF